MEIGQESSMEKRWLNSRLSNGELEYRLSKSINSLGSIESEGSIINNMNKNIPSHSDNIFNNATIF